MPHMSLLGHIRYLSEYIGSRGSASEGEAQVADHGQNRLSEWKPRPEQQPVLSATSAYVPLPEGDLSRLQAVDAEDRA